MPKSFGDTFEGKPGMHRRQSSTWGDATEEDYRQSRACYYSTVEQLNKQNYPQFSNPNNRVDIPQGGIITGLTNDMREIQFALKILF